MSEDRSLTLATNNDQFVAIPIDIRNTTRAKGTTGEGTPSTGVGYDGDPAFTLTQVPMVVAFDTTQITHPENRSDPQPGDPSPTLSESGHPPTIAFHSTQDPISGDVAPALSGGNVAGCGSIAVLHDYVVRRLTPLEYERLQGFPDYWTLYGKDGKKQADGKRYKQVGNAVAVPVAEWIARRLSSVAAASNVETSEED